MSSYEDRLKKGSYTANLLQKGNTYRKELTEPEFSEDIPENIEEIELQINSLKNRMWEVSWLIGKRLLVVKDKHLEGTEFLSISDYAKSKFGFERRTTYRFMFIAKHFDQVTARTLGSKLRLLEPLNEDKRNAYLEWMKNDNPTFREIELKIKEENKKDPISKEKFLINKNLLKVDFQQIGTSIPENKTDDFLRELEELIKKYIL